MYYPNNQISNLPNPQTGVKPGTGVGMPNTQNNFMMSGIPPQGQTFMSDPASQEYDPMKHLQMPMTEANDPMNRQQQMMALSYLNAKMMTTPFDNTNYMAFGSQNTNPQSTNFESKKNDQGTKYEKRNNFGRDRGGFGNNEGKRYDDRRNNDRGFERSRSPVKDNRDFRDRDRRDNNRGGGNRGESRGNFGNRRDDRRNSNRHGDYNGGGGDDNRDRRDFNKNRSGGDRRDNYRSREGGNNSNNNNRDRSRDNQRDTTGDWDCPKCNNHNWARRDKCHRCHEDKPAATTSGSNNRVAGSNDGRFNRNRDNSSRGGGNQPRFQQSREGDWRCTKCNSNNFANRQSCYRCHENRSGNANYSMPNDDNKKIGAPMDNTSYYYDNSQPLKVSDLTNPNNRAKSYDGFNGQIPNRKDQENISNIINIPPQV